ncbi:FIST signal transduction protein [Halorarius halobius]|uniref:FIST signal transduction protein n=1 Tax=Halorarius halobius TaxID=2962671 RepID=UPI0020CC29EB|nr:FIST N-terminal domain-containing protein [Halorarius halobius]
MAQFGTGLDRGDDGAAVARRATRAALSGVDGDPAYSVVFCSSRYDYETVVEGVREETGEAPLVGCSSAGEFTDRRVADGSVAVAVGGGGGHRFFTGLGTGLRDDETAAVREAAGSLPTQVPDYPHRSVVNLHDGLAGKGEELSLTCLNALGQNVRFAGGSAGDDLNMERTCVFRDDTVAEDAVALGQFASTSPPVISVEHGHEPISPPLTVTRAEGNTVHELDGRPAFEVWKEHVAGRVREEMDCHVENLDPGTDAFAAALTNYVFGLETGTGLKIRWPGPTTRADGPIEFTCSIPEGTVLRVAASSTDEQVASAREAARSAAELAGDTDVAGALVFDCICRSTSLGDRFAEAVDAIDDELGVPFIGFETYGEMAMERGQLSGYHNTTTVIMLLPE